MRQRIPQTFVLLALIGPLWCLTGHASEAEREVERYRAETVRKPESIRAWIGLSDAYLRLARERDDPRTAELAESAANAARELDATDPGVMYELSKVKMEQGRFNEAVVLQSQVLAREPLFWRVWGAMGDAYMELGRYRSADSCYAEMFAIDEGFGPLLHIARSDLVLRDFESAIEHVDRAIDVSEATGISDCDMSAAYALLGEIFFAHGYWEAALENIDASLALNGDAVRPLALKAEILRFDGRGDESHAIRVRLCELSPHPHYLAMLARSCADRGEKARADSLVGLAASRYESWAETYPDAVNRRRAAFMLDWNLDPAGALSLAYRESRKRRDIYAYELLAWAYYKNGKFDLAWSSIALALRKEAKDPRIYYRAAAIAKAAGKNDKYEAFKKKSTEANPRLEAMYGPL